MSDSGCLHPDSELVVIPDGETLVSWCALCGSIRYAGTWRAPSGLVLPGWTCGECQVLNGCVKELLTECRGCGAPRRRL